MSSQTWAWGANYFGQLGDNSTTNETKPTSVYNSGLTSPIAIAAGDRHSLAIDTNGKVWAWGANHSGQLGIGTSDTQKNSPTSVVDTNLFSAKAIACGGYHSLAIDKYGKLWAWGANGEGQLGNGTTTNSSTPTAVNDDNVKQAIAIACGLYHSLAIDIYGKVWAWGVNYDGQLGIGSEDTQINTPTLIANTGLNSAKSIACGGYHSLAIDTSGKIWGWGRNDEGQLGMGYYFNKSTIPMSNSLLTTATAIAAGQFFSLATDTAQAVWAWGDNDFGQLGNGSTTRNYSPIAVNNTLLTNAIAITCGTAHSLAIDANKKLFAWGYNSSGQLGDGGTSNRSTPTPVNPDDLKYALDIAAGNSHSLSIDAAPPLPPSLTRGIPFF